MSRWHSEHELLRSSGMFRWWHTAQEASPPDLSTWATWSNSTESPLRFPSINRSRAGLASPGPPFPGSDKTSIRPSPSSRATERPSTVRGPRTAVRTGWAPSTGRNRTASAAAVIATSEYVRGEASSAGSRPSSVAGS